MAVIEQEITDRYAIYNGDCIETMQAMPKETVHLSVYSPPYAGLYHYSSSPRDISNCRSYEEFFEHYGFVVSELNRITKPGRITAVHCSDIPSGNSGRDHMIDLSGDIIRLHEKLGWKYVARYCIWKDPFVVYLRTLAKTLRHRTCVEDSSRCSAAAADYLLVFRHKGDNAEPIHHPNGLTEYLGAREVPKDLLPYKGRGGKQTENKFSQWVWRQYASAFWDDIRLDRVLPFRDSKDPEDEKHVHPLQLDVIDRAITLWSNPGDVVFTPFMGVGSEVFGAVRNGRKGLGVELKPSYYKQSVLNLRSIDQPEPQTKAESQHSMFDLATDPEHAATETTEEEDPMRIAELEEQVTNLKEAIASTEEKLWNAEGARDAKAERVTELEAEVGKLQDEIGDSAAELSEAQDELHKMQIEHDEKPLAIAAAVHDFMRDQKFITDAARDVPFIAAPTTWRTDIETVVQGAMS